MKIRSIIATITLTTFANSSLLADDPVRDFWFNGAEINRYALTQARYGQQHPGYAEFIFVTELDVLPGALFTRFTHQPIEPSTATGTLTAKGKQSRYSLHYPKLSRTLTIDFDHKFPHIIRAWKEVDTGGTTRAVLEDRIMNSNYWSEHNPADRVKRKYLGLEPIAD